ncbi:MAG: carbon-nitrogen family hydrolase [Ignavibacteriaceae bacterium]
MKITLVQFNPDWEDKSRNIEKLEKLLEANAPKTQLIVLPEMTLTGFTMNSGKFSEKIDGESFNFFSDTARRFNSDVIAGIIEQSGSNYFNTLLHVDKSGNLKSRYRKIHPFSYSTENIHYSAGNEPVVTEIDGVETGLSICYDLRFPELYRLYAKKKVKLLINIANWPDTRITHWKTLLKARAIENQCFFAAVNRVGKDLKLNYTGQSNIIDPMGYEIITTDDKESIITAEFDINKVDNVRSEFPFLKDIKLI